MIGAYMRPDGRMVICNEGEPPMLTVDPVPRGSLHRVTIVGGRYTIDVPLEPLPDDAPVSGNLHGWPQETGYEPDRVVDPDCAAGKHTSCVGDACQCPHHVVNGVLRELGKLSDKHGPTTAAVMLITGLTAAEIDAVGGIGPA